MVKPDMLTTPSAQLQLSSMIQELSALARLRLSVASPVPLS